MKNIHASFIGSFLEDSAWHGKVVSVYSRAVNIENSPGILYSILAEESQMSGYGITAGDLFLGDGSMGNLEMLIGKRVEGTGDRIVIGDVICINISTAKVYSGKISPCTKKHGTKELEDVFGRLAGDEGFSPVITGKIGGFYTKAAMSVLERVNLHNKIDLSPLVGMGIGFTPSGDDFISGVLLYLNMYRPFTGEVGHIADLESIRNTLGKTSPGGRTLLTLVLKGSFPYYLRSFARSLCGEKDSAKLAKAVSLALEHGATSGSDAITGFLWIAKYF